MEFIEQELNGVVLKAPSAWWYLTEEERASYSNGCGPKTQTGWLAKLIPEHFWGLDVSRACDIHDACWAIAKCYQDFKDADNAFLDNLVAIVGSVPYPIWKAWLKWLRNYRAMTYFNSVRAVSERKKP